MFVNPTVRAAFPSVVGGGVLTRANAVVGGTFSTSLMAGPALGGLLVAAVGVDIAFVLDSATYLVSAALLSRITLPRSRPDDGEEGFVGELRFGFAYLAGARAPGDGGRGLPDHTGHQRHGPGGGVLGQGNLRGG